MVAISKIVNDLEGVVKLVKSLMCYLRFIQKTVFSFSIICECFCVICYFIAQF